MFLLAAAAIIWGLAVLYTLKLNPEIHYYVQGAEIKDRWAERMAREHGPKILVYGGSSCAFSIDGERMLSRFGLPAVNYGRGASLGAALLTESVLGQARPGDTLIVALEPALLTAPLDPPAEGVQFSFAVHHPEWVMHPILGLGRASWFQALNALRPGGAHLFTLLGKFATRKPLMRYHLTDYRPSGFEQTAVRLTITGPAGHEPDLSADGSKLLRNLRAWCDAHQVRVAYSMPWSYTPPDQERAFQKLNIRLLLEISEFLPVLKDPALGANTNLDFYSDTVWHLNGPGSQLRTDRLAEEIKNWDTWTRETLRACDSELGRTGEPAAADKNR
ncbi:MAG: hypothetical protein ABSH48_00110 [Verrucomicrobiota bacterium]